MGDIPGVRIISLILAGLRVYTYLVAVCARAVVEGMVDVPPCLVCVRDVLCVCALLWRGW